MTNYLVLSVEENGMDEIVLYTNSLESAFKANIHRADQYLRMIELGEKKAREVYYCMRDGVWRKDQYELPFKLVA